MSITNIKNLKMKGESGVCSTVFEKEFIRRTKYTSKKHAQEACDFHTQMGYAHKDSVVYKCKICKLYHFGKPEWAEKLGKNE